MANVEKTASFEYYTYELTPRTTHFAPSLFDTDLDDFGVKSLPDLREKKNEIFKSAINSPLFYFNNKGVRLQHQVLHNSEDFIILRVANKKHVRAEIDFQPVFYPTEPSILVLIDNRKTEQQIAIEKAPAVFSSTSVVMKMLQKSCERFLLKYSLSIAINNRFNPQDFWSLINSSHRKVKELKIELTRENLSDIYRSISQQLVDYGEATNSQTVTVTQQAPNGGSLENINPQNEQLNDMVNASAKGTGPIKVKFVGDRKSHSTEDKKLVTTVHYDISAEGLTIDEAERLIKEIFK